MTKEEILAIYTQIYDLTSSLTVAPFDCGALCAKRCCRTYALDDASAEEQEYGMELYPGEELFLAEELETRHWLEWRFLDGKAYHLPISWEETAGVYFVGCKKPCPRERRPLQCRLFPYKPVLKPSGKIALILDKGAPNYCPLTEAELDPQARTRLEQAMQLLIKIPKVRELLLWDAQP